MDTIETARRLLRDAIDRQCRACSHQDWLKDQAAITRHLTTLAAAGCDQDDELERAHDAAAGLSPEP